MNEIVIKEKRGVLYADSRDVAQVLGIEHEAVMKLLREKKEFGIAGSDFKSESAKRADGMGGTVFKYALLSERQCLILITFVRNSDEAVKAKVALVDAFMAMQKELSGRTSIKDKSKKARNDLTLSWKAHGADAPKHFINLTYAEYGSIGYAKPRSVKKSDMSRQELARLAAFEALETLKLETRDDINGYHELKDSLYETGAALETAERIMISRRA